MLPGCSVDDDLADRIASSEQTVLPRQLSLSGKQREMFDRCKDNHVGGENSASYCASLYPNANTPVRLCMAHRGCVFTDPDRGYPNTKCSSARFQEPAFYKSKWVAKLDSIVAWLAHPK
jgi:hypothetical protein